jgi:hypothetical protein
MMKKPIADFLAKAAALAFAITVMVVTVYRAQTRAVAAEPVKQRQTNAQQQQQPEVLLQSTKDAVVDFVDEKDPVLLQSTKFLVLDGHVSGANDLLNTSKSGIVHPVKVVDVDQLFLGSSKSDSITFLPTSESGDVTPVFLHTSKSAAPIEVIKEKKPAEKKAVAPKEQTKDSEAQDQKKEGRVLFKSSKSGRIRIIQQEKQSK